MTEIEDNLNYMAETSQSSQVSKARLFIHAAGIRLWRLKAQVSKGDKQMANDLRMLKEMYDEAIQFLKGTSHTAGLATVPDLSEFR